MTYGVVETVMGRVTSQVTTVWTVGRHGLHLGSQTIPGDARKDFLGEPSSVGWCLLVLDECVGVGVGWWDTDWETDDG